MNIEILNPYIIYIFVPILILISIWILLYKKSPTYIYTLLSVVSIQKSNNNLNKLILFLLKFFSLLSLILAIARLRSPDNKSKLPVKGIDIILSLDASGSMNMPAGQDNKSRFQVAKEEAIKFIDKRENDSIGLVIFANVAVSRCPLTQDKNTLKEIINNTDVGQINEQGTVLTKSLLIAINRLKYSDAKSKIIILLTDGNPTPNDANPELAIELAKKLNIKIYTIAIGSNSQEFVNNLGYNFFGFPIIASINTQLLKDIAKATNGNFFMAKDPEDLEKIYSEIDQLEKSEHEAPVYAKYYEYFILFLWVAFILLFIENLFAVLIWPSL